MVLASLKIIAVVEVLMKMLKMYDKYSLSEEFIEKKLSLSIENLLNLPDVTHMQVKQCPSSNNCTNKVGGFQF